MTADQLLAAALDAWRADINSEPFPEIPTLTTHTEGNN